MRHHTALRVTIDGVTGWHYASTHRTGGYPLGECANHQPHPTEAEARECYAAYRRGRIRLNAGRLSWTSCEAAECPNPTQSFARIEGDGFSMTALCPDHMTIEDAISAMHLDTPEGDRWIS